MADKLIPIREYADTAAQLAADNDVILDRQLVIEKDTGRAKIGDGATAYSSLAYIFEAANNITGTGTTNYLAKFTAAGVIGNSQIQDDGTNVGINTSPVSGTAVTTQGDGTTSATFTQKWKNSVGTEVMSIRDDGRVTIGTSSTDVYLPVNIYFQASTGYFYAPSSGIRIIVNPLSSAAGFLSGDSGSPHASAIIEAKSTTRGLLPPRGTTAQMNAISSPAEGLIFYDTSVHKLYVYDGTVWQACW